jgi:lipopolysaccharide export LptBFGC system permease protein LptF
MSYEESDARRQSNMRFKIVMDIGMGLFYTVIGVLIVAMRSFANRPIPPWIAYLLGSMMAIGGVLRLIRGIKAVMPRKENNR